MDSQDIAPGSYVLVFDGVCNLCNGVVRFIIERDPARRFRFAPMQSESARELIERHYGPDAELDTFLLIGPDGRCRVRSDAAIAIARALPRPWPLLGILWHVPVPLRDGVYRLVARYRYRVFGRRDACMAPASDVRDRFLS